MQQRLRSGNEFKIPPAIRSQFGLLPGTEIHLKIVGDTLQLRKESTSNRRAQLVAAMCGRGQATSRFRTDEREQRTRERL
ncbi:hypothetical protein BZZ01_02045 [Nostocales cyanobacterium HT-58-2]|nr:hypothetical protein BZZ01_02045 [Nostocales cyanobacterium HT-58-2]